MTAVENFIVKVLPTRLHASAKAVVGLAVAILLVVSLTAGAPAWVPIALAVANAPLVWATPNVRHAEDEYAPEHAA